MTEKNNKLMNDEDDWVITTKNINTLNMNVNK